MQNVVIALGIVAGLAVLPAGEAGPGSGKAPGTRHLIYLHGRIVQERQTARPRHPEYGHYELEAILKTFRDRGFVVTGGIRPKGASVSDSADQVVGRIRRLLESGVPADHVTVVGGSMGAAIALEASARLRDPGVRFALLGACLEESVRGLVAGGGMGPVGRVLSIREASDELTEPCPPWRNDEGREGPLVAREVILHTGLRHGFLYRPLPDWVNPVVEWAEGN